MTRQVFWEDPYLTTLPTHLTSVNGAKGTVAETIFYALSGGQESDAGSIGGNAVQQAQKSEGHAILYTLADAPRLAVGDPVTVVIDWERRYKLMRLHFATELVLECTHRHLLSIEKIGAHIAADKARIDFAWPENLSPALPTISSAVHALIADDHPIISAFSDVDNERRYWEIAGFARVPCGGTHLRRTGEVGAITIKRKNVGGGKERIDIALVNPSVPAP
jgi:Ser-tRNA(Ala) deacylase AlaX